MSLTRVGNGDTLEQVKVLTEFKNLDMVGCTLILFVDSFMIELAGTLKVSLKSWLSHLTMKVHRQWILFECLMVTTC